MNRRWPLYLLAAGLSLLFLYLVMDPGKADWTWPVFGPHTPDLWFHSTLVKGMLDNGWYLSNPYLGAPEGSALQDFTYSPNLHMAAMKLLSLFSSDYVRIFNFYFLLTWPLTAIAALYSFRRLGASPAPALLASLLFTCLPFHFTRGQGHLMYASYYLVPLACLVLVWVANNEMTRGRMLASAAICALISFDLPYYSFFAVLLLSAAGLCAWAWKPAAVLTSVLLGASLLNLAPSLLYSFRNGRNPAALARNAAGSEVFGLKIAQLLLPLTGHRVPALAALKNTYNLQAPLVNENDSATLGLIGSAGFLLLIARLFRNDGADTVSRLNISRLNIARLNLAAVLVGTLGGFGALLAFTVFPMIRGYNRISVPIAWFSLLAVALAIGEYVKRPAASWTLCAALLLFGVWDQTSPRMIPPYAAISREMRGDDAFVKYIEASQPAGAMIFQLPYQPFPEAAPVADMGDYSLLKGYLHSRRLRWSYGAIKGRPESEWQSEVSAMPAPQMAEQLILKGFQGLYIDRAGYAGRSRKLEAELAPLLGATPIESENQRLAFYPLGPFASKLRQSITPAEWERRVREVQSALTVSWPRGCYPLERSAEKNWRWCTTLGVLSIGNPTRETKTMELDMRMIAARDGGAKLTASGPLLTGAWPVSPAGAPLHAVVSVPPGVHQIQWNSDGLRADAPNDPREMVFAVENFRFNVK